MNERPWVLVLADGEVWSTFMRQDSAAVAQRNHPGSVVLLDCELCEERHGEPWDGACLL